MSIEDRPALTYTGATTTAAATTPRSRRRLRRALILPLAATALLVSSLATMAAGTTARTTTKPVKPDYSYFAGKTINWIVGQSPGGTFSIPTLIWAPFLENLLHATINVSYVPAGNSITAQNEVAGAVPNGLTIGTASAGNDVSFFLSNTTGLNFSLQKQTFLVGLHINPVVFVACAGSNITSWKQVMDSTTPISMLTTTGVTEEHAQILMGAYKAPTHFLTGYASTTLEAAGCLRGDAPIATIAAATFTPSEYTASGGPIRPLLLTSQERKGSAYYNDMANVPTVTDYYAQSKPTTAAGKAAMRVLIDLVGPSVVATIVDTAPHTPAPITLALQDAFKQAMRKASILNALNNAGLVPAYMSPTTVLASIKEIVKKGPSIERYFTYGS